LRRPDDPISEDEVLEWADLLASTLEKDQEILSAYGESVRQQRLLLFDQDIAQLLGPSIDLLLKKAFRDEFSELLFGNARLIGRGFSRILESDGNRFLRKWGLAGIVVPVWDDAHRDYSKWLEHRYALLASFPIPIMDGAPVNRDVLQRLLDLPRLSGASRPPSPIQNHEVSGWAENIRAEIHQIIGINDWRPPNPRLTPEQWFYTLEQTIDLLSDDDFRKDFSVILYGKTDGHDHGYGPEDEECRQLLRRKWGVRRVEYPLWENEGRRYLLLTAFPVPWRPWTARKQSRPGMAANSRLDTMHRDELSFHPHYLLTCSGCGSTQGALVPLDCLEDSVPGPREQVRAIMEKYKPRGWKAVRHLRRLAEHFSEEMLGFESSALDPRDASRYGRVPLSGAISELLDYCMGFHRRVECPSAQWLAIFDKEKHTRRRILLLAGLLQRLRCQGCNEVGTLRYRPKFSFPIETDIEPGAQGDQVVSLAVVLQDSEKEIASHQLYGRVLAFPEPRPRQRFLETMKRLELRHQDMVRDIDKNANPWLLAIWVAEALTNWVTFCSDLGFDRRWRAQNTVTEDLETAYAQLQEVHRRLSSTKAQGESLRETVAEAHGLLEDPGFALIASEIAVHSRRTEKLINGLAQYRHRLNSN